MNSLKLFAIKMRVSKIRWNICYEIEHFVYSIIHILTSYTLYNNYKPVWNLSFINTRFHVVSQKFKKKKIKMSMKVNFSKSI